MSKSIKHLDFYPEDPETINALHEMALLDVTQQKNFYEITRKKRLRIAVAGAVATMALSGAGMGYMFNRSAHGSYHSTLSRVPETAAGAAGGIGIGLFIAAEGLNLLGRRFPNRRPVS